MPRPDPLPPAADYGSLVVVTHDRIEEAAAARRLASHLGVSYCGQSARRGSADRMTSMANSGISPRDPSSEFSTQASRCPDRVPGFSLHFNGERLELHAHGKKAPGPIFVNLEGPAMQYRLQHGGGRGEQIAKAVGLRRGVQALRIVDASAGLAEDACVLAALGCYVLLYERNPIVVALLQNGLQRLATHDPALAARMQLQASAAPSAFAALPPEWIRSPPDVVYFDPMFAEKGKRSASRKEMQFFKLLVGADEDAGRVLANLLKWPVRRVVVKRALRGPILAPDAALIPLAGKACRFDVYPKGRQTYPEGA